MLRHKNFILSVALIVSSSANAGEIKKFIKFAANNASMGTYMADLEREKQAIKDKYDLQLAQAMQQMNNDANTQMREILQTQLADLQARGERLNSDLNSFKELLPLDTAIKNDIVVLLKNQKAVLEMNNDVIANFSASQQLILQQMKDSSIDINQCNDDFCVRFSVLNKRLKEVTANNQALASADNQLRSLFKISLENLAGVNGLIAMTMTDIQMNDAAIAETQQKINSLK